MASFRLSPGFITYKLKLDTFNQPEWAVPLDFKRDVLKKLTSITVGVHCDKCVSEKERWWLTTLLSRSET